MARAYSKRTYANWEELDPVIDRLLAEGRTMESIAKDLGINKADTLRRHLRQRKIEQTPPGEAPMRMDDVPVEVLEGQQELIASDTEENTAVSTIVDIVPVSEISELLSPNEVQSLEHYEQIIAQGLQTFVEVGHALLVIRDQRLYRQAYPTFEDYLRQRWDLSRPRAYQLISAAQVIDTVSTIVDIVPVNESQARPLTSLPPERQAEVWREAVETAPPSGITAKHVQETVKRAQGKTTLIRAPKPQEPEPKQPARKAVQDELTGILKVIPDDEAWPVLATLWTGVEYHYRTRPNITESALEVSINALKRLIPFFPQSTVESFQLGVEPRDLEGVADNPATE